MLNCIRGKYLKSVDISSASHSSINKKVLARVLLGHVTLNFALSVDDQHYFIFFIFLFPCICFLGGVRAPKSPPKIASYFPCPHFSPSRTSYPPGL